MTEYFYKVLSIILLVLLLVVGAGLGFEWWLAAHDRDQAKTDLKAEQGVTAGLRVAIGTQNKAVEDLGKAKAAADVKRVAAEKVAAVAGKKYDQALANMKPIKAVTCADAMPAVNQLLKDIQ